MWNIKVSWKVYSTDMWNLKTYTIKMQDKSSLNLLYHQLKVFMFEILLSLEDNKFTNPIILLIFDICEIFTLHYFYINPIFTHLYSFTYLAAYFQNIYQYIYFIPTTFTFPSNLAVLCGFLFLWVVLLVGTKCRVFVLVWVVEGVSLFIPLFLLRIPAEIMHVFNWGLMWGCLGCFFSLLAMLYIVIVLHHYCKLVRFVDMVMVILIVLQLNTSVLLGFLCVRLIVIKVLAPPIYAKNLKLLFEVGLLSSSVTIMFIPENTLNYIMLLTWVIVLTLTPCFRLYNQMFLKKLYEIEHLEEGEDTSNIPFTMNEIKYIRQIEEHRSICMLLQCDCESLSKVHKVSDLHKWARVFHKEQLRIKYDFQSRIKYAETCLKSEEIDFSGLILLMKGTSRNIFQEYHEFRIKTKYEEHFQKANSKSIAFVNNKCMELKEQIIGFEDKIMNTIDKILQFWEYLNSSEYFAQTMEQILEISEKINEIKRDYETIYLLYDEIPEIQYFYAFFQTVVLNSTQHKQTLQNSSEQALIIVEEDMIIQASRNLTKMLEIPHHLILNQPYRNFIPAPYIQHHSQWVKNFLFNYKQSDSGCAEKILRVNDFLIKVINMQIIIIPRFEQCIQMICVVSEFEHSNVPQNYQFHFLIQEENLEILGYEDSFFRCLHVVPDETVHLHQRTISQFFPNINKESLTKSRKDFSPQVQISQEIVNQMKNISNSSTQYSPSLFKIQHADDRAPPSFRYTKIPLPKTTEIGLFLLHFTKLADDGGSSSVMKKKRSSALHSEKEGNKEENPPNPELINILKYFEKLFCFCTVFILLGLIFFWIIYEFGHQNICQKLKQIQYKGHFLHRYSEMCLWVGTNGSLGSNTTEQLKELWIEGFGLNPSTFNTFSQIDEHLYHRIFTNKILQNSQKDGYIQYKKAFTQNIERIREFKLIMTAAFSVMLTMLFINMIFNLIGLVKVEIFIGKTLEKFLKIQMIQVCRNISRIQSFVNSMCVTEVKQAKRRKVSQMADEMTLRQLVIQSFLQPIIEANLPEANKKRRVRMKQNEDGETPHPFFQRKKKSIRSDQQSRKKEFFVKRFSINRILSDKWGAIVKGPVCWIFFSVISIIPIFLAFSTIFTTFELCLQASFHLQAQSVLFVHKYTEYFFDVKLPINRTISQFNFETQQVIKNLSQRFELSLFIQQYHQVLTKNICDFIDQNQECKQMEDLFVYGMQTLHQIVQEAFRVGETSINDEKMKLIFYVNKLTYDKLQTKFYQLQDNVTENSFYPWFRYLLGGTLFVFFVSVILQIYAIRRLQRRVNQTVNIFTIVPPSMQDAMKQNQAI